MVDQLAAHKAVVTRLVDEVLNGGNLDVIDQLYIPDQVEPARAWIAPFHVSFPDVQMASSISSPTPTEWPHGSPAPPPTPGPGSATHPRDAASTTSTRSPSTASATASSPTAERWKTTSTASPNSA